MTLVEFIELYDRPGVVVLFFGKRNIPLTEAVRVHKLGKLLVSKTQHILFRSGNAKGADEAFINGVAEVDRVQLVIPWNGHRKSEREGYQFYSLDDLTILNEDRAAYTAFTNQRLAILKATGIEHVQFLLQLYAMLLWWLGMAKYHLQLLHFIGMIYPSRKLEGPV
jgi:hypothetical protein